MDEWINEWTDLHLQVATNLHLYLSHLSLWTGLAHGYLHTHTLYPKLIRWVSCLVAQSPWSLLECSVLRPLCLYSTLWFWSSLGRLCGSSLPKEHQQYWGGCVHRILGIQEVNCQAFISVYLWREGDHADKLWHSRSRSLQDLPTILDPSAGAPDIFLLRLWSI